MPPDPAEDPVFDPVAIEKLRRVAGPQSQDFVSEMAQLFLSETSKSLQELRKACAESNWKKVSRLAHSVKSSSATLGLMRLSNACRELEIDTLDAEATPSTLDLAGAVLARFDDVIPVIKDLS